MDTGKGIIRKQIEIIKVAALTVLSAVPEVGHPLAFVFAETMARRRFERVEGVLDRVGEELLATGAKIGELDARTDAEALGELIERALIGAASTAHNERREAYAALIVNAILDVDPNEEEQRFFVEFVDKARPIHLAVLSVLTTELEEDDERTVADVLPATDRDSVDELASLASTDLFNWGLTQVAHTIYGKWKLTEVAAPPLKPLGRKCLDYITMPTKRPSTEGKIA